MLSGFAIDDVVAAKIDIVMENKFKTRYLRQIVHIVETVVLCKMVRQPYSLVLILQRTPVSKELILRGNK